MSSAHVCLSVILSLCYSYFLASKIPKGIPRLISLLPVFYFFTILPLYFSSAFAIGVSHCFITWLANFKLLIFAFDHGPLNSKLSLPIFIAMAALPLRTKQHGLKSNEQKPTKKKIPLNLGTECILLAILLELTFHHRNKIHPNLVLVCYCFMLFFMVDIVSSLSSSIVQILVGVELEPPSNEPYLSTSIQDFWGKRWNLPVTHTLRLTVYNPVKSALSDMVGKKWAPRVAMLATFVVSGLMHELLFYYINRVSPSWEMTWFFVFHGICVLVEIEVKRAVKDTWRFSWFVSWSLTFVFLTVTTCRLFYPPITRNGADIRLIEQGATSLDFLKEKMLQLPTMVMSLYKN